MNRILKLAFAGISLGISSGLTVLAIAMPSLAHAGSNQVVSRDYPWSADHLTLDVDANVSYHPGPVWHLTVSAPRRELEQLVVRNGRIEAKEHACFSLIPLCFGATSELDHTVDVALTGPALRAIEVDGAGTIDLDGLRQHSLMLKIEGDATVRGNGSVSNTTVDINGAGNIQLAQLTERHARVVIHGSGTVDIAPTESVSVRIDGAGTVRLHSSPARVTSHIYGAGEVIKVPASPPAMAPSAR